MQTESNKASPSGWGWQWIVLALAFAGAMVADPTQAATLTVINTDDSGAGSLRQAIADAAPGDTITFDSTLAGSTITLTSGQLGLDKDLSIEGDLNSDGVPDVTVSGNDTSRVFSVSLSAVVGFEGLVITAGRVDGRISGQGGGIMNSGGTVALVSSSVSGNRAEAEGGGIYNQFGTLTLTNSTVSDNIAGSWGGGIFNTHGTVTLINITVSGNNASGAGGIFNDFSDSPTSTVTLINSTVSSNSTREGGGGGAGGGIRNIGIVTLTNSTVSDNIAGIGGGIFNNVTVTLINSTVSNNKSGLGGAGGIFNEVDGRLRMVNTIISNSETNGVEGGDCENDGFLDTANSTNNLIETGCDAIATLTDDPELGPLQDNGGPTETHALLPGSPAIDFIPVADCEVSEDQRGVSRPQGSGCDIGAFERAGPPAPVPAAGKWALGVLAMLLLSAMVLLDRRQQRHFKGR